MGLLTPPIPEVASQRLFLLSLLLPYGQYSSKQPNHCFQKCIIDNRGKNRYNKYSWTLLFSWNLHSNQEMFKLSSLDVTHAALVNKFWHFGGNEKSQRFIERCIQTFPTFCLLGPEGNPVCWDLMDQTGEIRMAGTLPEYRKQGLISYVIYIQTQALNNLGFPIYSHTDKNNKIMQKMSYNLHHIRMPCTWNQWYCVPL